MKTKPKHKCKDSCSYLGCGGKAKPAKTNEAGISNSLTRAAKVIDDQYAVQCKIFEFLNGWAKGDHMKQWSRVSHEDVIGQVYADLASHFAELKAAALEGK